MKGFEVGNTVIIIPVMPGLDDIAGQKAIVEAVFTDTIRVMLTGSVKKGGGSVLEISKEEVKHDN